MKNIIILIVIIIVCFYILKNKPLSRIEMIDYLNMNAGNANGQWVNMSDDELKKVYKIVSLVKQKVAPATSDYLQAVEVGNKYKLELFK